MIEVNLDPFDYYHLDDDVDLSLVCDECDSDECVFEPVYHEEHFCSFNRLEDTDNV